MSATVELPIHEGRIGPCKDPHNGRALPPIYEIARYNEQLLAAWGAVGSSQVLGVGRGGPDVFLAVPSLFFSRILLLSTGPKEMLASEQKHKKGMGDQPLECPVLPVTIGNRGEPSCNG